MTQEEIKKWIKHAYEQGYPVKVVFEHYDTDQRGLIIAAEARKFTIHRDSFNNCVWRNYAGVVSVEPLEPEVEKAEDVYEYIKRELSCIIKSWQTDTMQAHSVRTRLDGVLAKARNKYGDVGGMSFAGEQSPDEGNLIRAFFTRKEWAMIDAALKEAGIE